jgi:hypothetical protein
VYSDGIMHELYNLEKVRARTRSTHSITGSSSHYSPPGIEIMQVSEMLDGVEYMFTTVIRDDLWILT